MSIRWESRRFSWLRIACGVGQHSRCLLGLRRPRETVLFQVGSRRRIKNNLSLVCTKSQILLVYVLLFVFAELYLVRSSILTTRFLSNLFQWLAFVGSVILIKRESNYYAISVHVYFIWPVFYYWTLYRPLGSHLAYCPWNLKLPVIYVFTAKLVILILTKSVLVALCLRISLSPLQSQMPSDTAVWSPGQRNLTLSHLWPYLLWILFWLGWFPRLRDLRLRGRRHRLCSV